MPVEHQATKWWLFKDANTVRLRLAQIHLRMDKLETGQPDDEDAEQRGDEYTHREQSGDIEATRAVQSSRTPPRRSYRGLMAQNMPITQV